jgi:hypothetical protein
LHRKPASTVTILIFRFQVLDLVIALGFNPLENLISVQISLKPLDFPLQTCVISRGVVTSFAHPPARSHFRLSHAIVWPAWFRAAPPRARQRTKHHACNDVSRFYVGSSPLPSFSIPNLDKTEIKCIA